MEYLQAFFLFIHYSHVTYQIMARICAVRFLSEEYLQAWWDYRGGAC